MRIVHPVALVAILLLAACATPTRQPGATQAGSEAGAASAAPAADPATRNNRYSAPPPMQIDPARAYSATIETTKGPLQVALFAAEAPKTVNNFVFLAREGFYDGVTFHRIIKGFMVQTGDPTGTGTGGPGYRFEDEPVRRSYTRGTLAMANSGPNTNGSQFFIVHQDTDLPPNYTIFGQITQGLEVLDAIADTPVTMGNSGDPVPSLPTEAVRILRITIHEQ